MGEERLWGFLPRIWLEDDSRARASSRSRLAEIARLREGDPVTSAYLRTLRISRELAALISNSPRASREGAADTFRLIFVNDSR